MGACIDQFKYFTFTVFESPFEKVADIVRKGWGGSGKYTITDVPFSFNLYEECPLNGGAHMEKAYFYAPESSRNQCVMFSELCRRAEFMGLSNHCFVKDKGIPFSHQYRRLSRGHECFQSY